MIITFVCLKKKVPLTTVQILEEIENLNLDDIVPDSIFIIALEDDDLD